MHALSLDIAAGEVFGVLGPNGSGKSTLFRVLTTMLRPTAGQALILGHDITSDQAAARAALGVVFQSPSLDDKLTAVENIVCQGALYGLSRKTARQRGMHWLDALGIDAPHRLTETLSGGQRRRVEIAKALVHEPAVLLMDEPASGLDPGARRDLWQALDTLRADRGLTIALTTHLMDEADRCDRLAVLSDGALVAVDTPAALRQQIGGHVITIEPQGDALVALAEQISERFGPWADGAAPRVVDGRVHLEHPDGPATVAAIAAALPGRLRSISASQPTLEDVFLHMTGHTFNDAREPETAADSVPV